MRILIVGYGSIGARHGRIAAGLGMHVACVSANLDCPFQRFDNVAHAIARFVPDCVIIANATAQHADTINRLALTGFDGGVLIEKPVYSYPTDAPELGKLRAYVAYNLRFHPLVQSLRAQIKHLPKLYSASLRAGQYLPQWRPGTDYRQSYSARREQGGGVLRDLSHEIDLALWLCGPAERVTALGGQFSELEISSDDVFSTLSVNQRCQSVSININYLDRMPQRSISLNGPGLTAVIDLVNGSLSVNGEITRIEAERDVTYTAQLKAFVSDDTSTLCTLNEGIDVVRFIGAAQNAAEHSTWIQL